MEQATKLMELARTWSGQRVVVAIPREGEFAHLNGKSGKIIGVHTMADALGGVTSQVMVELDTPAVFDLMDYCTCGECEFEPMDIPIAFCSEGEFMLESETTLDSLYMPAGWADELQ